MTYRSMMNIFILLCTIVLYQPDAIAKSMPISFHNSNCADNPTFYKKRSNELQELATSDQMERKDFTKMTPEKMVKLAGRDLQRRKRVGQIFAEGCFKSAMDYENAALIFQHGDVPDHYYQSFIWANKAGDLGDKSAYKLASMALDRYLVSIGKKQLFGSQYYMDNMTSGNKCLCMQPVESSFPDLKRKEYSGRTLSESYKTLKMLNEMNGCNQEPDICKTSLQSSLSGSVPGFW